MNADPHGPPGSGPTEPHPIARAAGAADPYFTELAPGEQPLAIGTLFLCSIILMIIAAVWVIMYLRLID